MTDFWKKAPVGGEFTSSLSMEEMLKASLSQTVELIRESHTTFLGPNAANPGFLQGYETVLKNMGYRLWISEAILSWSPGGAKLEITWENNGTAPFYKNWKVWLYVTDETGNTIEKKQVEILLPSVLPGESIHTATLLETEELLKLAGEKYNISVGVEDPMTGKMNVRFAMQCEYKSGKNFLW